MLRRTKMAPFLCHPVRPLNFGLAIARRRALDRSAWRLLVETGISTWHARLRQRGRWCSMTNTHRLYADAIQLSSGVASAVCIKFAASLRRILSTNWKLNMLRIYPVELTEIWKLQGHDCRRVSTHRPTQLNSSQHDIVQFSISLPNPSAVVVS